MLIHTFTFAATLVRSSALGTGLSSFMDCEGMRLQGHGVQRACIVLIYFRLVFKPGTSQTYELPWSWRQDRHSILLPLVQAHFPSQALALKEHTVWPEILAGRYFGGLLKICLLAEFTLAVGPVSHNDIHSKMANRTRWEFNRAMS